MFSTKCARLAFILLFLVNILTACFYIQNKQGWHVDEQWSYGHANSTKGAYLTDNIDSFFKTAYTNLHDRWRSGKIYHDYLTVQPGEQFKYGHIWENLKTVEHPPLFYVLVHTICSFTPDVISPWQIGSLNLIAFALSLIFLYKLAKLYIKDDYLAIISVFWWGFSEAGLATVLFLRMYMLQTLFAIGLLYEVSQLMMDEKIEKKRLFKVFLWSTLGILTHYSSIFFSFFVTLVFGIIFLIQRKWNKSLYFALIMLTSVIVLFVIFPNTYNVLTNSFRGTEAISKATKIYENSTWSSLFYGIIQSEMFSIYFKELLNIEIVKNVVLIGAFIGIFWAMKFSKIEQNKALIGTLSVLILMTIYIHCLMPNMYIFQLRYYMMCIPIMAIILIYYVTELLKILKLSKKNITVLCGIFVLWHSITADFKHSVFRFNTTEETKIFNEKFKGKRVAIAASAVNFWDIINVLSEAKEVYWVSPLRLTNFPLPDYFIAHNSVASEYCPKNDKKVCFYCIPEQNYKFDKFRNDIEYIGPYRNGIVNFDVYKKKYD